MDSTSETLLHRLKKPGDARAWERFVRIYTPLLWHWALRTGCAENDAADLVQEALTLLVRKLPVFDYNRDGRFRAWLRTVAHNCWRNLGRRAALPMDDNSENLRQFPDDEEDDPIWEAEYRFHVARRALELMQSEFQPATWKACWAMVVDGKSAAEVSGELGMSAGAVYVAKSRVLARLRRELEGMWE